MFGGYYEIWIVYLWFGLKNNCTLRVDQWDLLRHWMEVVKNYNLGKLTEY